MSKLIGVVFAFILGLGVVIPDAEAARRLGGGKSLGMQRQAPPPAQRPQQAQQAAPQQPGAAAAPAAGSRWLGPVAGLLAGGLIGALIFGGAFDGIRFMDIVLILALAAGVFFLFRMLRKPQAQYRRNEPMHLRHIVEELARDRGETPERTAAASTATARAFFGLPEPA